MFKFWRKVIIFGVIGFILCFVEMDGQPLGSHLEQQYQTWSGRPLLESALSRAQATLRAPLERLAAYPWEDKLRLRPALLPSAPPSPERPTKERRGKSSPQLERVAADVEGDATDDAQLDSLVDTLRKKGRTTP